MPFDCSSSCSLLFYYFYVAILVTTKSLLTSGEQKNKRYSHENILYMIVPVPFATDIPYISQNCTQIILEKSKSLFELFEDVTSFQTVGVVQDVMSHQQCNVISLFNAANSFPIHNNQTTLLRPTGYQM